MWFLEVPDNPREQPKHWETLVQYVTGLDRENCIRLEETKS